MSAPLGTDAARGLSTPAESFSRMRANRQRTLLFSRIPHRPCQSIEHGYFCQQLRVIPSHGNTGAAISSNQHAESLKGGDRPKVRRIGRAPVPQLCSDQSTESRFCTVGARPAGRFMWIRHPRTPTDCIDWAVSTGLRLLVVESHGRRH